MTDYLEEIEAAYSRCRERYSMLSPLDWALAAEWEKAGIPLHIAVPAITECCKKFRATKDPCKINTLRYFDQAVRQRFAAWSRSRTGAHNDGTTIAQNSTSNEVENNAPPQMCDKCRPHHGKVLVLTNPDAEFSWDREQLRPCPDCSPLQPSELC